MALAAGLAVAAPTISLARDRDDFRGRDFDRHERNGRNFSFGLGINTAPSYRYYTPNVYSNGYYNGYGNNQVNGYYDNQGCFHPY